MDCQETQKFIHAYLDGEFDEHERVSVTAHLEGCERCRKTARLQGSFRRALKELHRPVSAPPRLRARVRQCLVAEDRTRQRKKILRWVLVPAAAAAMVVGVVQVSWSIMRKAEPNLAEESISRHRQGLPMDVTGPNSTPVKRFFSNKVPFAVRPPKLDNPRARLVGARLSNLGPSRAAFLVYNVNGRRVSVFITDPNAITSTGNEIRSGNRKMYHQGVRGYNVLKFVSGGTGYTVTSDMDQDRLVRLVSHVR